MSATDDPHDDDARAAEYVLHLMDADDRLRFEDRLRDDARLRGLVHAWEAHFAPLADQVEPVTPPEQIKAAVLNSVSPAALQRTPGRAWLLGLLGLAAAAAVAFVALGPVLRGPDLTPQFQAELASADGELMLIAGVIPPTHEIIIEQVAGAAPEGRVLELWLIAEGADAPVSLGLLEADGSTRIRVPDEIAPGVRTGTIAVSLEPPGGSPTGTPTGPVLATGTFSDL